MKSRGVLMMGVALAIAGTAVFAARGVIEAPRNASATVAENRVETTRVVVAAMPLKFGNKIGREHITEREWPANSVPNGAFVSVEQFLGNNEDPRVALRGIEAGEPLLKTRVSGFGGRGSLAHLIDADMRAFTIRSNLIDGVAGFVMPGDNVDVLLTRQGSEGGGDMLTDILMQNIKVLGINQDADDEREDPSVAAAVTVEVTPEQAQKLTLAQRLGDLTLALRNITNAAAETPKTVTLRDLRVGEANIPDGPVLDAKPERDRVIVRKRTGPTKPQVTVVRGMTASKVTVAEDRSRPSRIANGGGGNASAPESGGTADLSDPIKLFQD